MFKAAKAHPQVSVAFLVNLSSMSGSQIQSWLLSQSVQMKTTTVVKETRIHCTFGLIAHQPPIGF